MRINLAAPSIVQLWILVAFSALAWSFGPICVRFAFSYDMPPALLAFGRLITGVIIFSPYILYKGKIEIRAMPSRSLWLSLAAGALIGIYINLMTASLEHISVIINQALVNTIPIWVAIFEVTFLRSKFGPKVWFGIIISLVGGFLIAIATSSGPAAVPGGDPALGILMALFSACSAALYIVIGRSVRGSVSFVPYIWLAYSAGAVVTLLIIIFNGIPLIGYDPRGYLWVLLLAILAQVIGHGALNFVIKFISPTPVTMTTQSIPVMSAIWAFFFFGEIPTILQTIGSIILIVGVVIVLWGQSGLAKGTD